MTDDTLTEAEEAAAADSRGDIASLVKGSLYTRFHDSMIKAITGDSGVPWRIAMNFIASIATYALFCYGATRLFIYLFYTGRWGVITEQLESYVVGDTWNTTGREFWHLWLSVYLIVGVVSWIIGMSARAGNAQSERSDVAKILAAPILGIVVLLLGTKTITPTLLTLAVIPVYFAFRYAAEYAPEAIARKSWLLIVGLALTSWLSLVGLAETSFRGEVDVVGEGRLVQGLSLLAAWAILSFAINRMLKYINKLPGAIASAITTVPVVLLVLGIVRVATAGNFGTIGDFGGILLTVVVTFLGVTLSFPIGLAAALARRSSLPILRALATGYIELIRGVPLLALLLFASTFLGLFWPANSDPPDLILRVVVVITFFTAAYIAEDVRGGLQSVPRGQYEAGMAIGLPVSKITNLIVLPQALRNSIPALIGQFISLLKDTSLLSAVGIKELLGVGNTILSQIPWQFQGYEPEVYAFAGLMYWVIAFSMSRQSERLERRLGVGER